MRRPPPEGAGHRPAAAGIGITRFDESAPRPRSTVQEPVLGPPPLRGGGRRVLEQAGRGRRGGPVRLDEGPLPGVVAGRPDRTSICSHVTAAARVRASVPKVVLPQSGDASVLLLLP